MTSAAEGAATADLPAVYVRVQEWLGVLGGLAEDTPELMGGGGGAAAVMAARDCVCGLVKGRGLGAGSNADDEQGPQLFEQRRFALLQSLYHLRVISSMSRAQE